MAYSRTTITEAELAFYYGAGVDAGVTADASDFFVKNGEAYLTALLEYQIVTNWATMTAIYKELLKEYIGRLAAVSAISYNMAAYTTPIEAENMLVIHWARLLAIEKLLKDASVQDFMGV